MRVMVLLTRAKQMEIKKTFPKKKAKTKAQIFFNQRIMLASVVAIASLFLFGSNSRRDHCGFKVNHQLAFKKETVAVNSVTIMYMKDEILQLLEAVSRPALDADASSYNRNTLELGSETINGKKGGAPYNFSIVYRYRVLYID